MMDKLLIINNIRRWGGGKNHLFQCYVVGSSLSYTSLSFPLQSLCFTPKSPFPPSLHKEPQAFPFFVPDQHKSLIRKYLTTL